MACYDFWIFLTSIISSSSRMHGANQLGRGSSYRRWVKLCDWKDFIPTLRRQLEWLRMQLRAWIKDSFSSEEKQHPRQTHFQLICIDSVMTQHWLSVVSAPNSNIYCMLRRNWRNIYNSVVYQLRLPNNSAINQLRLSCSAFQPITQLTFRALFRFTRGKFLMVYAW